MLSAGTIKLLRVPFSVFLSPLYFFALSLVPEINWFSAILLFVILHFLIYPASNGYNSYMDRDSKSIGGLEKPPPPSRELYQLTIVIDIAAILLSIIIHPLLPLFMLVYIGASRAYSYRGIRLKKYPITGYLTVIVFQGALTFALVYFGAGNEPIQNIPWEGMLIASFLIGGFYPLTQIYQHQQDLDDGVKTISYKLGYNGTFIFCGVMYAIAWFIMAQFFIKMGEESKLLILSLFFIPVIVYFIFWFLQVRKDNSAASFGNTMKMTWLAALCTNAGFITLLIWRFV